jgi:hypothetical protein
MQYAGRAVQLAQELFGDSSEDSFVDRLAEAKSNIPEYGDGRHIYQNFVKPARVDWERAGAHYAVSSLFEDYSDQTKIYCFEATREDYQLFTAGAAKMAVGRVRLASEITRESQALSFAVLHMGDHHVNGGVRKFLGEEAYAALKQEAKEPFMRADLAQVIRILDRRFGDCNYSVSSLFRDEQRKVLDVILGSTLREAETLYRQIYERRAPTMRFLTSLHIPLPKALGAAAGFVLNGYLRAALEQEEINPDQVRSLLETTTLEGVAIDAATLEFAFRHNLERLAERLAADPTGPALKQLQNASSLIQSLPFAVDLWTVQNIYYALLNNLFPRMRQAQARGNAAAKLWSESFSALGRQLGIRVPVTALNNPGK